MKRKEYKYRVVFRKNGKIAIVRCSCVGGLVETLQVFDSLSSLLSHLRTNGYDISTDDIITET